MQGFEDHYFRFTSDELFNGLPAQLVDKSLWIFGGGALHQHCGYLKILQNEYNILTNELACGGRSDLF